MQAVNVPFVSSRLVGSTPALHLLSCLTLAESKQAANLLFYSRLIGSTQALNLLSSLTLVESALAVKLVA
jgi:hypothetical protein